MDMKIREAREMAGLAQNELAAKIGVAPNTLHGYESGKHDPRSDMLIKIAKACGVTVDFLLGLDTKKPPAKNTLAVTDIEHELIENFRLCTEDDQVAIRQIVARVAAAAAPAVQEEQESVDERILRGLEDYLDNSDLPAGPQASKEA